MVSRHRTSAFFPPPEFSAETRLFSEHENGLAVFAKLAPTNLFIAFMVYEIAGVAAKGSLVCRVHLDHALTAEEGRRAEVGARALFLWCAADDFNHVCFPFPWGEN